MLENLTNWNQQNFTQVLKCISEYTKEEKKTLMDGRTAWSEQKSETERGPEHN